MSSSTPKKQQIKQLQAKLQTLFKLKPELQNHFLALILQLQQTDLRENYLPEQLISRPQTQKQQEYHSGIVLKLRQVWQLDLQTIVGDSQYEDEITCEKGAARMTCGHYYSRSAMRYMVQTHVNSVQFQRHQIMCSHFTQEGRPCNQIFTIKEWTFIGGFTISEVELLKQQMSRNWIDSKTKLCPKCSVSLMKLGMKSSAVKCPSCNSKTFCFNCLENWIGNDYNAICQSDCCRCYRQQVVDAPWTRKFRVYEKITKVWREVFTPTKRACPRCKTVIANIAYCKHTKCPCMYNQDSFCFICLGLYQNGEWPCGDSAQYCGSVAPVQSFK